MRCVRAWGAESEKKIGRERVEHDVYYMYVERLNVFFFAGFVF